MLNRAELTLSAAGEKEAWRETFAGTSTNAGDNVPKGEIYSTLRENMSESQQLHV